MNKLPFHSRFQINVDLKRPGGRLVNRVTNQIFDGLFQHDVKEEIVRGHVLWEVANDLEKSTTGTIGLMTTSSTISEKCLHAF